MAKEGSTVSGLMDTYATAISLALQYGVPLRDLVNKFAHVRFEPSGFTGNSEIPIAKSIVDYIFRWLGSRFLAGDDRAALGIQDRGGTVVGLALRVRRRAAAARAAGRGRPVRDRRGERAAGAPRRRRSRTASAQAGSAAPPRRRRTCRSSSRRRTATPTATATATATGRAPRRSALAASLGAERTAFKIQEDAPSCMDCGSIMVRNGSCYKCLNCGSTSGCS